MSLWVKDGGHLWPRTIFEDPNPKPGACPLCGGTGRLVESIDPERHDVLVACHRCQVFCKACDKHVRKSGHACKGARA
jgi:hypothetical protein